LKHFRADLFWSEHTMQRTFTSRDVVKLTGISARQLQWWDERGLVVPARQGHRRVFTLDDLAELAVICELRGRGFSLQKIRKVIRFLQKELGKRLVETVTAASEYHLLTDGRHIFLEDSARGVVDLLKNARQPMLTVCLSDTIQRVLAPLAREGGPPKGERAHAADRRGTRSANRALRTGLGLAKRKRNGSVRHLMDRRKAS
jgi:DNA-binding transcriptional MerR regulator